MATGSSRSIPGAIWRRLCYFRRTRRLVRHLRARPGENLTLDGAASIAGMERTAFSRFFHREIGLTFSEFQRVYRVHLAVEHLLASNISVKELAPAVGFRCVSTFARNFRREVGMSPAHFRARLRRGSLTHAASGSGNRRISRSRGIQSVLVS